MKNILLIEDDISLSNGIKLALQSPENQIIQCFNIREARQTDTTEFSLVILDINLPDGNGLGLFAGNQTDMQRADYFVDGK